MKLNKKWKILIPLLSTIAITPIMISACTSTKNNSQNDTNKGLTQDPKDIENGNSNNKNTNNDQDKEKNILEDGLKWLEEEINQNVILQSWLVEEYNDIKTQSNKIKQKEKVDKLFAKINELKSYENDISFVSYFEIFKTFKINELLESFEQDSFQYDKEWSNEELLTKLIKYIDYNKKLIPLSETIDAITRAYKDDVIDQNTFDQIKSLISNNKELDVVIENIETFLKTNPIQLNITRTIKTVQSENLSSNLQDFNNLLNDFVSKNQNIIQENGQDNANIELSHFWFDKENGIVQKILNTFYKKIHKIDPKTKEITSLQPQFNNKQDISNWVEKVTRYNRSWDEKENLKKTYNLLFNHIIFNPLVTYNKLENKFNIDVVNEVWDFIESDARYSSKNYKWFVSFKKEYKKLIPQDKSELDTKKIEEHLFNVYQQFWLQTRIFNTYKNNLNPTLKQWYDALLKKYIDQDSFKKVELDYNHESVINMILITNVLSNINNQLINQNSLNYLNNNELNTFFKNLVSSNMMWYFDSIGHTNMKGLINKIKKGSELDKFDHMLLNNMNNDLLNYYKLDSYAKQSLSTNLETWNVESLLTIVNKVNQLQDQDESVVAILNDYKYIVNKTSVPLDLIQEVFGKIRDKVDN